MPFLEVAGGRLWYADSGGAGQPIVLMHPAAGSSDSWVYQIEPLTAAGYRCLTYDLRGWGRSVATDQTDPGAMSDDLLALVDAAGLSQFILIAAAYGGFGGLDFALRFPTRLRGFVLATSQGGLSDPDYRAVLERTVSAPIRGLPKEIRELGPSYRAESPAGVERWLAIDHEAGADDARRQRLHLRLDLKMLQLLTVPTLLIAGGADLLAPPALMRLLANHLPMAQLEVIGEAGHSAHWERPEDWNRLVMRFLARLSPTDPGTAHR
jgi:pimeloyl-ACP methyl ester carboxylesterase